MNKKILVVEDEEGLRLLYQEELETEGYQVITAQNGREAIKKLEEKPGDPGDVQPGDDQNVVSSGILEYLASVVIKS